MEIAYNSRCVVFARESVFSRIFSIGFLAYALLLPGSVGAQDDVSDIIQRIWTYGNNSQVSGEFVAKFGDVVKVEKYDGTVISLSYAELIPEDRAYVDTVVRKFGSAPGARTWSDINLNNFRGTFIRPVKSELEFMLVSEDRPILVETIFISDQDIDFILSKLNGALPRSLRNRPYRVWTYRDANNNELRSIGRYSRLEEEAALLGQLEGSHLIPLNRLSKKDLDYIRGIDEFAKRVVDRILNIGVDEDLTENKSVDSAFEAPTISPIWWLSLGLIFVLMLGLISIKYVYESGEREYDDD